MNILFLDTETTGRNDRMIQLAYKLYDSEAVSQLFNPGELIDYNAMAVHHITNEQILDKPKFQDHEMFAELSNLVSQNIVVAHNASFDIGVLKNEGIRVENFICTLKVSRRLLNLDKEDNELTGYSLQYLRYALGLNQDGLQAHDALSDVLVLERLFHKLISKAMQDDGSNDLAKIMDKMREYTNQPTLLRTIRFGKYRGMKFTEIAKLDENYLHWLSTQPDLEENLKYTLDSVLRAKS